MTQSWPSRISRRTRLAPIRPSPTIPSCISLPPFRASVAPDQRVRGRVMSEPRLGVALQLSGNPLGEHLAELDAPLVEGVHAPDRGLDEHAVLVEGDELAERLRVETLREDRVRGPVALEDAMRHEPRRRPLLAHLLRRLAERERLG